MKATLFSLLTVTALAVSTNSAGALPPRYFNNSNYNANAGYSGYYPNYYQGYSYGGYYHYPNSSYSGYYYPNGSSPPSTSLYGPNGRGGALHPAPMSYRYGGNQNGYGRP